MVEFETRAAKQEEQEEEQRPLPPQQQQQQLSATLLPGPWPPPASFEQDGSGELCLEYGRQELVRGGFGDGEDLVSVELGKSNTEEGDQSGSEEDGGD